MSRRPEKSGEVSQQTLSLEEYVDARRRAPDKTIDEILIGPPDNDLLLSLFPKLQKHDINPAVLVEAVSGDERALDLTCVSICSALTQHRRYAREHPDETPVLHGQKAPLSLIRLIVFLLLKAIGKHRLEVPTSFLIVVFEVLELENSDHYENLINTMNLSTAMQVALDMYEAGQEPTFRAIGRKLQKDHKTVARWFDGVKPTPEFLSRLKLALTSRARAVADEKSTD